MTGNARNNHIIPAISKSQAEWVGIKDIARIYGVCHRTARTYLLRGITDGLPYVRFGRGNRLMRKVNKQQFQQYMENLH